MYLRKDVILALRMGRIARTETTETSHAKSAASIRSDSPSQGTRRQNVALDFITIYVRFRAGETLNSNVTPIDDVACRTVVGCIS